MSLSSARLKATDGPPCANIERAMESSLAAGNDVVISGDAIQPDPGVARMDKLPDCLAVWEKYRPRWSKQQFPQDEVYTLR